MQVEQRPPVQSDFADDEMLPDVLWVSIGDDKMASVQETESSGRPG